MANRMGIHIFHLVLSFFSFFFSLGIAWAMTQTLISHRVVSTRKCAEVNSISIPNQNTNQ